MGMEGMISKTPPPPTHTHTHIPYFESLNHETSKEFG